MLSVLLQLGMGLVVDAGGMPADGGGVDSGGRRTSVEDAFVAGGVVVVVAGGRCGCWCWCSSVLGCC